MSNWDTRILHLGLGRFHRGHQAVIYQKMSELGDDSWGVVSMSMRSSEARDQMRKVGLRYPVLELSAVGDHTTWVESIREALSLREDFQRVIDVFCLPQLEIITLTITEKGYDLDGHGKLDLNKHHIQRDLSSPSSPSSAIGLLAMGLRTRRLAGLSPLTVISCDNLRGNGQKLKQALIDYTQTLGWNEDQKWLSDHLKFPNTMVDRIVPSLVPDKISELEKSYGLPANSEVIATETFCQWVIEDSFASERPSWEKVGVQFVRDVRPFEEIKLKLLNASHSYLAYAGQNRGFKFVHEAIQDDDLKKNVLKLFEEVTPQLQIPENFDIKNYQSNLILRFKNNKLPHQLKQIAMDGSQKLPQRIFPSLALAFEKKDHHEILLECVREWLTYCHALFAKSFRPDDPESELLYEYFTPVGWKEGLTQTHIFQSLPGVVNDKIFHMERSGRI
jgi:fructuronate reductase